MSMSIYITYSLRNPMWSALHCQRHIKPLIWGLPRWQHLCHVCLRLPNLRQPSLSMWNLSLLPYLWKWVAFNCFNFVFLLSQTKVSPHLSGAMHWIVCMIVWRLCVCKFPLTLAPMPLQNNILIAVFFFALCKYLIFMTITLPASLF